MYSSRFPLFVFGLVAMFLVAIGGPVFAQDEPTYVSNTQCKICHNKTAEGEVWNKWKAMKHSKAFELLLGDEAKAVAAKQGLEKPPSEAPECLQCHVTGYDVEKGTVPDKLKKEDGVQCETCHGPASLHVADGKKFKTAKDSTINMGAHIVRPKEDVCKKCHNDKNPNWNPERYTLEDGTKVGFDFKQAWAKIQHGFPKDEGKAEEKKE